MHPPIVLTYAEGMGGRDGHDSRGRMVCDNIAHQWKLLARILQRERGLHHIAVAQGGSFDPQGRVSLALPTSGIQSCSGSNAARSEGSNAHQD